MDLGSAAHFADVATLQARVAANNAAWCDVVCRSHGVSTRLEDDAWTSQTRTPPFYPDAVSLVRDASVEKLLARIDSSAGCSIKDSFASLDLSEHGFRVLFESHVDPSHEHRSTDASIGGWLGARGRSCSPR